MPLNPEVLPAFLAAMALVELTPGPNMGYLAALSAARGRRAGLAAVAGATLGLAVYLLAAAFGLTEAFLRYPAAFHALRWAGVAYLLWLALEAWRGNTETSPDHAAPMHHRGFFWRGFTANVLNPKAAVFYVLILPGFIDPARGSPLTQAMLLGGMHLAISVGVHGGIVLLASRIGAWTTLTRHEARTVNRRRLFAIAIVGTALWLAFSR